MRTLSLRLLTIILLLACGATGALAQDNAPEFKMPCQQVLKLGLDKFVNLYGERTQDYSTYGMKQAFAYYVDCKRPVNDERAKRLTDERRKQVNDAREALQKLGNAAWMMRYVAAGGGTMWGLASVGAYAEREDYMTRIIASYARAERKLPIVRRRAKAHVRRAEAILSRWSRTPELDFTTGEDRKHQEQLYQDSLKEAREASAQLKALVEVLPDSVAERVAWRVAEELTSALSEEEVGEQH